VNWDAIGAIAELTSAVAVVATLAYLAVQIRQANLDSRSSSRRSLIEKFSDLNSEFINNTELLIILGKGLKDWSALSNLEKSTFEIFMGSYLENLHVGLLQYRDKVLDRETLDHIGTYMVMAVQTPGGKTWYADSPWPSAEVRRYIQERLLDVESIPPSWEVAMPHLMAAEETRINA